MTNNDKSKDEKGDKNLLDKVVPGLIKRSSPSNSFDKEEDEEERILILTRSKWEKIARAYHNNVGDESFDCLPLAPQHTDEEYELLKKKFDSIIIVSGELEDMNEALGLQMDELKVHINELDRTLWEEWCYSEYLEARIKELEAKLERAEMFNKVGDRLAERVLEARK